MYRSYRSTVCLFVTSADRFNKPAWRRTRKRGAARARRYVVESMRSFVFEGFKKYKLFGQNVKDGAYHECKYEDGDVAERFREGNTFLRFVTVK